MTLAWNALLLALTLSLSGCASYALLGGSRTLAPRSVEVAVGGGYAFESLPGLNGPLPVSFAAVGRYGLTERIDVGARVFTAGAALCGRAQIYRSPEEESADLSALAELIVGGRVAAYSKCNPVVCMGGQWALPQAQLRVIAGFRQGRFELALGPHLDFQVFPVTGGVVPTLQVGGDVALLVELFGGFRAGPEIVVLVPVGLTSVATTLRLSPDTPQLHVAFGIFKVF